MTRYRSLFFQMYDMTRKLDFDGEASLLRACLILSAFQYLNLLTVCLVWMAVDRGFQVPPKPLVIGSAFTFLLLNAVFAKRHVGALRGPRPRPKRQVQAVAYLIGSGVLFVAATGLVIATR